jgi:hypothetical protein
MLTPAPPGNAVKATLRATQVLCLALMMGVVAFVLVMLLVLQINGPSLGEEVNNVRDIFLVAAGGIGLACFFVARIMYKRKMSEIGLFSGTLDKKMEQYRAAMLIYMALLEGAALFSIIVYFMVGIPLVLIITAAMLLAMFVKYPFIKRVNNELNLDWQEQQELL